MVWKKERQVEEIEKIVGKGFSEKFNKKTEFPIEEKDWRDFGQVDFEDHQLTEKEKRDLREMKHLEREGLL